MYYFGRRPNKSFDCSHPIRVWQSIKTCSHPIRVWQSIKTWNWNIVYLKKMLNISKNMQKKKFKYQQKIKHTQNRGTGWFLISLNHWMIQMWCEAATLESVHTCLLPGRQCQCAKSLKLALLGIAGEELIPPQWQTWGAGSASLCSPCPPPPIQHLHLQCKR
jgi:hypothetical protein